MRLRYKLFSPKMKAKYQFGSPIVALYAYQDKLVVATKLEIYITEDAITYTKVKTNGD